MSIMEKRIRSGKQLTGEVEKMVVSKLIEILKRCPQDAIVMYQFEKVTDSDAPHFPIDDVLVGSGTLKGFVFLAEEIEIRGETE